MSHILSGSVNPDFKPLHNVCEYLNAVHIYADDARRGETRAVEAHHYCSEVSKDLRQCLIYDSGRKDARLIGIEYMIPKHVYEKLDSEEQKLWHSHEFEVSSGMLVIPKPSSFSGSIGPISSVASSLPLSSILSAPFKNQGTNTTTTTTTTKSESESTRTTDQIISDEWDKQETEMLRLVSGLYGKTWHFWQVDRGDELPLGYPKLMGSLTTPDQADLDKVLENRNREYGVDHKEKAEIREKAGVKGPGVHENADSWWKENVKDIKG